MAINVDWKLIPVKRNYSIYKKFNFDHKPIAVNYCFFKPEGFKKLDKPVGLCEMPKVCNEKNEPFYITAEDEDCIGKRFLGLPIKNAPPPRHPEGGRLGINLGVFQRPEANLIHRQNCISMVPGSVHYVLFTPLDQIVYEPDLVYFVCTGTQGDVILRANSYSTGEPFEAIGTTVGNCTNLFIRPYQNGKINYMVSGFSWGMNGRRVYPDGLVIIVVPYQKLGIVTENLHEMVWYRDALKLSREDYIKWDHAVTMKTSDDSQEW